MKTFLELAKERYSVRAYDTRPVEDEKIALILEAGKVAPTACNYQPQTVYAVKSEENRKKLAAVTPCTFSAPVVFVVTYDEAKAAHGMVREGFDFGQTDSSIVCSHMMFEAWDLGLGSCWVGRFNEDEVKKALSLPDHLRVAALLPVGYAAENAAPSNRHEAYRPDEEITKII